MANAADRKTVGHPHAARAWAALAAALLLASVCASCASPRTQGQSADLADHNPDASGGTAGPSSAPASGPVADQPHDADEVVADLVASCRRGEASTDGRFGGNGPFGRPEASYRQVGLEVGLDWSAVRPVSTQWLRGQTRCEHSVMPPDIGDMYNTSRDVRYGEGEYITDWVVHCRLSDGHAGVSLLALVGERETPPRRSRVVWQFAVLAGGEFWAKQLLARAGDTGARAEIRSWTHRYSGARTVLPQLCEAKVTDGLFYRMFLSAQHRKYHGTAGYRFGPCPVAMDGHSTISARFYVMGPEVHDAGAAQLTMVDPGIWRAVAVPRTGSPKLVVSAMQAVDPSAPWRTVRVEVGPAELDCPDVALTDGVLRLPRLEVFEWGPPAGSPDYEYRGFVLFRDGIAIDYWLSNDPAVLQLTTTCPADAGRGSETQAR